MRAGLQVLIEDAQHGRGGEPLIVLGEAATPEAAQEWARNARPEVIIYDLAFELDDTLSGLLRLRSGAPEVAVLALCESAADGRVLGALQAGAHGCLPKSATGPELLEAVEHAWLREPVLHPGAAAALLQQLRGDEPLPALSPREAEVLRQVAAGQTNKAIAVKLGISEHTVKFHLGSAMSKLGAASRAEAVATAIRRGLISV